MPSSATITAFYSFTAGTKARASQVNSNFDVFRGHLIPVDPTTTGSATNTYDLGSTEWRWRVGYFKALDFHSSTTTGARMQIQADTSATLGAFLFQINSTTIAKITPGGFPSNYIGWTSTGTVPITGLSDELITPAKLSIASNYTSNQTSTSITTTTYATICSTTFACTVGRPIILQARSSNTGLFIRTNAHDGTERGSVAWEIGGSVTREIAFGGYPATFGTGADSVLSVNAAMMNHIYLPGATGNLTICLVAKKLNAGYGSLTVDQAALTIYQL